MTKTWSHLMMDLAPSETTNLGRADDPLIPWSRVRELLTAPSPPDSPGGYFPSYLCTVRPDGRPHATGIGVRWYDGDLYFLNGPGTRKSRNLAATPAATNARRLTEGPALVPRGESAPTDDPVLLQALGALTQHPGWPVPLTAAAFTAPFVP